MSVTVQRWGDDIGICLPKPLLDQLGLNEGARVEVVAEGDHLIIRRLHERPSLAELLVRCNPETRPETIDLGPPVGRETL